MRRNLLSLVDDLVQRLRDGRTTDSKRPRPVGSHSEGDPLGIAVHDLHVLEGHTESIGYDLCEGRLVTLAVSMGASVDADRACRVHTDLRRFEEPGSSADNARHL